MEATQAATKAKRGLDRPDAETIRQLVWAGKYAEVPNPLHTKEAAAVAGVSDRTIVNACAKGLVKSTTACGGKLLINRDSLLAFAGLL